MLGTHISSGTLETKSVLCVKAEIHNVLTSLRHGSDSRWSSKKRFEHEIPLKEEHTLLRAFKELHFYLEEFDDLRDVDTVEYLKPFLQVVTSEHTNASITMVALRSLNKFLLYDFISAESPRVKHAMNKMAHALTRCRRFNERVLMQLMQVSELVVRNPAGRFLTDDHICELFKVCYRVCRSLDASILLRQSAESTLSHIIITVFGRVTDSAEENTAIVLNRNVENELKHISVNDQSIVHETNNDNDNNNNNKKNNMNLVGKNEITNSSNKDNNSHENAVNVEQLVDSKNLVNDERGDIDDQTATEQDEKDQLNDSNSNEIVPYGTSCLFRLLSFIASLINPSTQEEEVRVLGLSLLNTILETGGEMLGSIPEIVGLIQSELCKYLLQDSQTEELPVLALVLRVIFNLFNSIKSYLKVQLEVFFTSVHLGICESRSELVTSEQKEIALESLLEFCREPALMVDLYKNYDCDVQCTNLFETLCACLCRNAVPSGGRTGQLTILHTLSLEAILAVLDSIARRCIVHDSNSYVSNIQNNVGIGDIDIADSIIVEDVDLDESFTGGDNKTINNNNKIPIDSPKARRTKLSFTQGRSSSNSIPNTPEMAERRSRSISNPMAMHTEGEESNLQLQKQKKKLLKQAAKKFNTDKKGWLKFAIDSKLVETTLEETKDDKGEKDKVTEASEKKKVIAYQPTPVSVARFLLVTPGLDKTIIGDYISEPADKKPFNTKVLKAYVSQFNFENIHFVEGIRVFLESFRLPGESQKIDRLMEAWAACWYAANPEAQIVLKNVDVAYVLAFGIIMLNTDLHNDQVQKKMTIEDFVKNMKGINDGGNVKREFLESIFSAIEAKQIRIKHDPGGGQVGNQEAVQQAANAWDSVVRRQRSVAEASFTASLGRRAQLAMRAGIAEREMFSMICDSALDAIDIVFDMTIDSSLALKAIEGFQNYAKITAYYNLDGAFNHLMILLNRRFSSFVSAGKLRNELPLVSRRSNSNRYSNAAVSISKSSSSSDNEEENNTSVGVVGNGSIDGHLNRGLATLETIVHLTKIYGNHVCEGWRNILNSILHLYDENLLPDCMSKIEIFIDTFHDPVLELQITSLKDAMKERDAALQEKSDGGILTSFASWFGAVDEIDETEEENMEKFLYDQQVERLRDAISPMHLETLFAQSSVLPEKSFLELLKALILSRDPTSWLNDGRVSPSISSRSNLDKKRFEEQGVFCIQMLSVIALANPHRINLVWDMTYSFFERILRAGVATSMPKVASQIVICILKVCHGLLYLPGNAEMLLSSLQLIPKVNLEEIQVENGLPLSLVVGKNSFLILKKNASYISRISSSSSSNLWKFYMDHLRYLSNLSSARNSVLDTLEFVINETNNVIDTSNISYVIPLLVSYLQKVRRPSTAQTASSMPAQSQYDHHDHHHLHHHDHQHHRQQQPSNADNETIRAIKLLFQLSRISSDSPTAEGELSIWSQVLVVFKQYFYDSRKSVSVATQDALQRSLLDPPKPEPLLNAWAHCFEYILLPLVDAQDDVSNTRLKGSETHVRAVAMIARTFLYNKRNLMELKDFHLLWMKIVTALAKPFAGSPPSQQITSLQFTARESLKNLLLVSKADGMFDIVSKRTNQDLWTMTFAIVENLAPGIKNDIAYALEPPNEEDDKKISEKLSAITTEQEKTQGNTENIDMNDKNEEQPIENSSDSNTAESVLEPQ